MRAKLVIASLALGLTTAATPAPRPVEICAGINQLIESGSGPAPFAALRGAAQRGSVDVLGKLVLAGFPVCHFRPTSHRYACDRLGLQEATATTLLNETRGKIEACFGKRMEASTRAGGVITNMVMKTGPGQYPEIVLSKIGAEIVSVEVRTAQF